MRQQTARPSRTSLVYLLSGLISIFFIAGQLSRDPEPPLQESFRFQELPIQSLEKLAGGFELETALNSAVGGNPTRRHLELPNSFSSSSSGGRLIFAHMGDGVLPGTKLFMVTELLFVNDSPYDSEGILSFFDNGGNPLSIEINGVEATSFPITIPSGEFIRVTTSGNGAIKSGWVVFQSSQPVAGTSSFSIRDPGGAILNDAGVGESILLDEFTLFADTMGDANTGIAVANPHETPLHLQFELRRLNGTVVATQNRTIPALGHLALFLDELFKNTPGIGEYEGSVVVSGDLTFGGITLRTVNVLWTSVPMVPRTNPADIRSRLFLPQVADGRDVGLKITTTILLFNASSEPASGSVEFLNSDGSAMMVRIGDRKASSFQYNLPARGVQRLATAGTNAVKVGWVRVKMDQAIAAAAMFHIADDKQNLIAEVGVAPPPQIGSQFNVIADSMGQFRTGFALVNTNEEGDEEDVTIGLVDRQGNLVAVTEVILQAETHQALFIDQLFADTAGIDEFEGYVRVLGGTDVLGMTLRQVHLLTTSLPSLLPSRGFSPVSTIEFAQNLIGSRPLVRWQVEQGGLDLALESLEISAPALGLDTAGVALMNKIGQGFYYLNQGALFRQGAAVDLIVTGLNGLTFDVVASGLLVQPGTVIARGALSGKAGSGLKIYLGPNQTENADWNLGFGLELDLAMRDGLFVSPGSAKTVTMRTTAVSSSSKWNEDGVAVTYESSWRQRFVARPDALPYLLSHQPIFFQAGEWVTFQGGNFGPENELLFDVGNGQMEAESVTAEVPGQIGCFAPPGIKGNLVGIRDSDASGSGLWVPILFAPSFELQRTSAAGTFGLNFRFAQAAGQLALADWNFRLMNTAANFSALSGGMVVGSVTRTGGAQPGSEETSDLVIQELSQNRIELGFSQGVIGIEMLPAENEVLVEFIPEEPAVQPLANGFAAGLEVLLDGIQFMAISQDGLPTARMEAYSTPTGMLGPGSGIATRQSGVF